MNPVDAAADAIEDLIRLEPGLLGLDELSLDEQAGPDKWSRKEILGHLIDSAVNNMHRFVRMQFMDRLEFPGYEQDNWVDASRYSERAWPDLVALWKSLNQHLVHMIRHVDPHALQHTWLGPEGEVTLEFVIVDYPKHMKHHIDQITTSTLSKPVSKR